MKKTKSPASTHPPPSAEDLSAAILAGDTASVQALLRGVPESLRTALSGVPSRYLDDRLHHEPSTPNQESSAGPDNRATRTAAEAASLACTPWPELKKHLITLESALEIALLEDRRPPFLQEYLEWKCRESPWNWRLLWHFVENGMAREVPDAPWWMEGFVVCRAGRKDGGTSLADHLLAHPRLIERDVWRLFEYEGGAETSLEMRDNPRVPDHWKSYDWAQPTHDWKRALADLCERGVLDRRRLLESTLGTLTLGFKQYRSRWFAAFHEWLHPSPEERRALVPSYLALLGQSEASIASYAEKIVREIDQATPLPASTLVPALEPLLYARAAATAIQTAKWIESIAGREPGAAVECARAIAAALQHSQGTVHATAIEILGKLAALVSAEERSAWAETPAAHGRHGATLRAVAGVSPRNAQSVSLKHDPDLDARPAAPGAWRLLDSLESIIEAAAATIERDIDYSEKEQVIGAISEYSVTKNAAFTQAVAPLLKRITTLRKRPGQDSPYIRALASWITATETPSSVPSTLQTEPKAPANPRNLDAPWVDLCSRASASFPSLGSRPLLATPTHQDGSLNPLVLVERWRKWSMTGEEPALPDQILSLLRLAQKERGNALAMVPPMGHEGGAALRFALGSPMESKPQCAPLWAAAVSARGMAGAPAELVEWLATRGIPIRPPDAPQSIELRTSCSFFLGSVTPGYLFPLLETRPTEPNPDETFHFYDPIWTASLWASNPEWFFSILVQGNLYWAATGKTTASWTKIFERPGYCPGAIALTCLALLSSWAETLPVCSDLISRGLETGQFTARDLGAAFALMFQAEGVPAPRLADCLRAVSRASTKHALQVQVILESMLRGDPAKQPRMCLRLLELLADLAAQNGCKVTDSAAIVWLKGVTAKGRTSQLLKALL